MAGYLCNKVDTDTGYSYVYWIAVKPYDTTAPLLLNCCHTRALSMTDGLFQQTLLLWRNH